jgi:hypothetical protein
MMDEYYNMMDKDYNMMVKDNNMMKECESKTGGGAGV